MVKPSRSQFPNAVRVLTMNVHGPGNPDCDRRHRLIGETTGLGTMRMDAAQDGALYGRRSRGDLPVSQLVDPKFSADDPAVRAKLGELAADCRPLTDDGPSGGDNVRLPGLAGVTVRSGGWPQPRRRAEYSA